ncbi:MAG: peptidase E [Candidatus Eremiobacteraeota bacterium]|nr:peptidase E [Candidatus Eremiobacteraeota bacterium]
MAAKRQIIAIGGAGFSAEPYDPLLDEYIIRQADALKPKICFLGTASGDSEAYIHKFYLAYGKLECSPTHISLFRPPSADLRDLIMQQQIVYVGGGNTKSLLALWREWSIDTHLREAYRTGVILCGVSAGSICWFEDGLTDSIPGVLTPLRCLGLLRGSNCPHYDSEPGRRPTYRSLVQTGQLSYGLAADDGVALHYVDEALSEVVTARPGAKAYRLSIACGQVSETQLRPALLSPSSIVDSGRPASPSS